MRGGDLFSSAKGKLGACWSQRLGTCFLAYICVHPDLEWAPFSQRDIVPGNQASPYWSMGPSSAVCHGLSFSFPSALGTWAHCLGSWHAILGNWQGATCRGTNLYALNILLVVATQKWLLSALENFTSGSWCTTWRSYILECPWWFLKQRKITSSHANQIYQVPLQAEHSRRDILSMGAFNVSTEFYWWAIWVSEEVPWRGQGHNNGKMEKVKARLTSGFWV